MAFPRITPTLLLGTLIVLALFTVGVNVYEMASQAEDPFDPSNYDIRSIAAGVSVILLLSGLVVTTMHFRHTRAAAYIERFNDKSKFGYRRSVDRWLHVYEEELDSSSEQAPSMSPPGRQSSRARDFALTVMRQRLLLDVKYNPELQADVKAFANLFQELGQAYLSNMADRRYTERTFDFIVPHYWKLLSFWIDDYRRKNVTLYRRFERMATIMGRQAKSHAGKAPETEWEPWIQRQASDVRAAECYIFAYGSLLNEHSMQRTLGDAAKSSDFPIGRLHGFARRWQALAPVQLQESQQEVQGVFLDLAICPGVLCNGLLVPIRDAGTMARLNDREDGYARVNVTQWVESAALGLDPVTSGTVPRAVRVYAYMAMPENTIVGNPDDLHATDGETRSPDVRMLDRYETMVLDGVRHVAASHEGFLEEFLASTQELEPWVSRTSEQYKFSAPQQNSAAGR